MHKASFESGAIIRIDGIVFALINKCTIDGIDHWQVKEARSDIVVPRPLAELEALYDKQALTFVSDDERTLSSSSSTRKHHRSQIVSAMPETERKRIAFRKGVIDQVRREFVSGCTTAVVDWRIQKGKKTPITRLEQLCHDAAHEKGLEIYGKPKSCSVAAFYRWCSTLDERGDQCELAGHFKARGNRKQLSPIVKGAIKEAMARLLDAAKYRKQVGHKPLVTMREIMRVSLTVIKEKRKEHPDLVLKLPCRSSFYDIYRSFPAYLRDCAKHGRSRARAMYRRPGSVERPEAALSCLQFDETRIPFFVVHEELQVPLGRPWLAFYVDEYSDAIVGFYLGFDPPGDLVIAATTKHACLMKSYVAAEYPDIKHPYLMGGIGRFFTYDNSLQAHAETIRQITFDLDVPYDFTPGRSPWVKGQVEAAFNVANTTFLQELPGFVLPRDLKVDRCDYDPSRNAIIGFRHLLWLWHHWLLDVYHPLAPRSGMQLSPNERWREGTKRIQPAFPDRAADLDLLFGIVRKGRLDHRGVRYVGLYYYSDGLDILRRKRGDVIDVVVRVNPINLERVHVWDPQEELWIPAYVTARYAKYAKSLDLHTHILLRQHANRISGRDDLEGWLEALTELQQLASEALPDALSISLQTNIARAMGIGTPYIFKNLDHDGLLTKPINSAPDLPLHPLKPSDSRSPPLKAYSASVAKSPANAATPSNEKDQRPQIPIFKTHRSLGRA